MMGAPSGELTLLISDSMIQVGDENWSLYARIFEGSYPNAEGVIPAKESLKHEFKVNRIALLDAVSYVQMMTSEKSSSVRITAKNSKLIISANTPDCGEADATIDCDGTADFVCHPEYMRHALKSLTEPEITINCDPMSLAMASANGITFIVMPMRIS